MPADTAIRAGRSQELPGFGAGDDFQGFVVGPDFRIRARVAFCHDEHREYSPSDRRGIQVGGFGLGGEQIQGDERGGEQAGHDVCVEPQPMSS